MAYSLRVNKVAVKPTPAKKGGKVVNLFDNAKAVPKKAAKKKAKAAEERVQLDALEQYAAICAIEKIVAATKAMFRQPLVENGMEMMIEAGCEAGERPDSLKAEDGEATAAFMINKRASTSPLEPSEIALLVRHGIPVEEVQDVDETYIFNPSPECATWLRSNKGALSAALKRLNAPSDIIMHQTSTTKTIVADNALDVLFTKPEMTVRKLIEVVGVAAIKPQYTNIRAAFKLLNDTLKPQDVERLTKAKDMKAKELNDFFSKPIKPKSKR